MFGLFSSKLQLGVMLSLVLALAATGWALKRAWEAQAVAEQSAAAALASAQAQEELRAQADKALLQREQARAALSRQVAVLKDQIRTMEATNEELRVWMRTPLPRFVVDKLREFTGGDAARESVPAAGPAAGVPAS